MGRNVFMRISIVVAVLFRGACVTGVDSAPPPVVQLLYETPRHQIWAAFV